MSKNSRNKKQNQDPEQKSKGLISKAKTFLTRLREEPDDDTAQVRQKPRKKYTGQIWIAWAVFLIAAICIYPFTRDFQIRALTCSGNYYYSASQIFSIADVSVNGLMILNSPSAIQQRLEENPLIEEATVEKNGKDLSIEVSEKMIIGYYVKDGKTVLVTADDERIPVENEMEFKTLVHYPLLVDLKDTTISQICAEVRKYPEQLTREVFERIAEIQPWEESYDKNMLKLVLQDGNTVFTSIPSLFMMSTYSKILENLQGSNVCLLLDGDNSVVNKISCTYMYLSPEERAGNREIPKSVVDPDYKEDEEDSSSQNHSGQSSEHSDQTAAGENTADQTQQDQQTVQQPAAVDQTPVTVPELYSGVQSVTMPDGEKNIDVSAIADWEASGTDGFQYSPSTGLFRATDSGIVYTYEAATDTFWPI